MTFTINPIGTVQKKDSKIYLEINHEFWDATTHLDLFSHAIILWWIDGMDTPDIRKTILSKPPKNKGPISSGVFSCRTPTRPNPIGHTIVRIISLDEKNKRIEIDHMDANDGTPLIDIKPYLPSSDRVDKAKVAPWFENLEKRYWE
ncbi:MAG: tRNA (N6-threonylcarbamoyladenosine(37)-N6)-methyltransferase TrmO [Candidatus Thorarchaeota archaeon]